MNANNKAHLTDEFLRDHQRLTQMLHDVVMFLERGDIPSACSLAAALDHVAGPHIEFEESILYPAAKVFLGESFERKLLAEHHNAKAGLKHLLSADRSRLRKPEFMRKVIAALRAGLKHAESCGTLASHLEEFPEEREQQALTELHKLKKSGKRWTELAG